ncbi:MAG: hypothetical protein EBV15_08525 [Bacteroidetes bacterium]|nr:hypothetical protein [Bacteroidota bacterium]
MKKLLLTFYLLLTATFSLAQKLFPVLDDYRPLKNAVSVNQNRVWDDFTDEFPLQNRMVVPGFTWYWAGFSFDTIYIGQGRIMAEKGGALINIGMFEDLCDRGIGTDTSQSPISWKIKHHWGRRILKIEWGNAGFFEDWSYHGICHRHLQFQLWLYEKDSRVELHCPREIWFRHAATALRQAEARLLLPDGQKIFAMTTQ